MQFSDNLSAEVVSSHTLIHVFCLYFCLCSLHKQTPFQICPCGFSMAVCFEQSMALLRGTPAPSLYPALMKHQSSLCAAHLSIVSFVLS